MFKEAGKQYIILYSPADNVDKLAVEPKRVEILKLDEFRKLSKPKPSSPTRERHWPSRCKWSLT